MDLSTRYMGLQLSGPFIAGASPLSDDLNAARELEEAGASALVMHSLFEEQIKKEDRESELYRSASTYFPASNVFTLTPEEYVVQLGKLKKTVKIPVIASLNGLTSSGWVRYAQLLHAHGADAVELNVYGIPAFPSESSLEVERRVLNVVASVRSVISIPLAVKILPFYTSLPQFAQRLTDEGADGIVLFNRSYFPSIDLEELNMTPQAELSGAWELSLRLRWLGVLYGRVNTALSVSGGVHTSSDALKALLTGADTVQMVSAILTRGSGYLKEVIAGVKHWMKQHNYENLEAFRGLLSLKNCPDPAGFDRGAYAYTLQTWNARKAPLNL